MTVNVQGAAAKLDAWIDFNGDGSGAGRASRSPTRVTSWSATTRSRSTCPVGPADGQTYARFRLSTAGDLGVGGAAADGEVEDYAVTIAPPTAASGVFGGQNTDQHRRRSGRSACLRRTWTATATLDVLSASFDDDKIAWYENDGSQNFTPHTITTAADGAQACLRRTWTATATLDVLSASSLRRQDRLVRERRQPELHGPHHHHRRRRGHERVCGGRGRRRRHRRPLRVLSMTTRSPGTRTTAARTSPPHTITTAADGAISVFAADVDGDGDLDVLSASFNDDKIAWYENDGSQNFTAHTISTAADGAYSVFAADVDGDGDTGRPLRVLLSTTRSPGTRTTAARTSRRTPSPPPPTAPTACLRRTWTATATLDVLSASFYDDKIAWYENDGSQNFTAHTISTAADGACSVFAADVDGDGDTGRPLRVRQ